MTDEEEFAARSQLKWTRAGDAGIWLYRRRRMGRVVPDKDYPGMWRSVKIDGILSDVAGAKPTSWERQENYNGLGLWLGWGRHIRPKWTMRANQNSVLTEDLWSVASRIFTNTETPLPSSNILIGDFAPILHPCSRIGGLAPVL